MSRNARFHRRFGKGPSGQMRPFSVKERMKARLVRHFQRKLVEAGISLGRARPPYYQFNWTFGELNGTVYSDSRSEARAQIKRDLGLRKKDRLPTEVKIERYQNPAYEEALQQQHANIQACTPAN